MPTKIEWCEESWNPITGCTPISEGCRNCYAKRMANRLRGRCGYPKDDPFKITFHPDRLEQPIKWRKPRMIFVCSMGDLFHKKVTDAQIDQIFKMMTHPMSGMDHHTYLILTKRPERILTGHAEHFTQWPNIWLGVTAENQQTADERIPILLQIPAAVRFVSCEPLLSEINLEMALEDFQPLSPDFSKNPSPIQWVICGGESSPGARPMHPDWARSIRDQCQAAGVPFFFKQWGEWSPASWALEGGYKEVRAVKGKKGGGNNLPGYRRLMYRVGKKKAGRILDGRTWDEYPR